MTGLTLPAGVVRRDVDVPAGPLAVIEARPPGGSTGTVLLVPGYTGSKEDFRLVLPALAGHGWRAVAVDQRGQHESPGTGDASAYTVDVLGREIVQLTEALGDGPVHLVGHSFGGLVTRAAVLHEPGRFRSHVLMGSGPAGLSGPRREVLRMLRPVLEQGGLAGVWAAMEALAAADPRAGEATVDARDFQRARLMGGSATALLAMGDALLDEPDRVGELAGAGVPTLVLYGETDDAWLPAVQAEMAARLGAPTVVVAGSVHSPAAEQPDATAAALVAFFSGR